MFLLNAYFAVLIILSVSVFATIDFKAGFAVGRNEVSKIITFFFAFLYELIVY